MGRSGWGVVSVLQVCVCGVLTTAHPGPAEAATGAEQETFYETATVEARPLATATAPVTVVGRDEVERLGAVTAADALRHVPGVTVTEAGTRGGLSVAQIRGGDPNFTLVLVDGVPVNDGTYQVGGVFDLEGLPASAIERIEVVRGPFASFYGSTGLGGVVHILTRAGTGTSPSAAGLRTEAELTAGDGDLFGGRVLLQGAGYALGASWEEEAERVADERFEQLHLHGKAGWQWGQGSARPVALEVAGRATAWDADDYPDASGGSRYGDGALRASEHEELGLSLQLAAGPVASRHHLNLSLYRHQLDRDSPAVFPLVPPSVEETTFTRLHAGWSWSHDIADGVRLSLGADVEHEDGDNQSVLILPPFLGGAIAGDYALERTTPGASVELLAARGAWTVELGARVDVPDSSGTTGDDPGSQFSPRLGVAYRLDDTWRLRASAGRAFKLPSFFALASPPALGGNPDLEPEIMTGGDVSLEWRSGGRAGRGRTEGGVGVFVHEYQDLVDFDFQLFTHLNRSRVRAEGIETWFGWHGAVGTPAEGWSLLADLTYQDVEDDVTGLPLRQRPEWSGGLRVDWRPTWSPEGTWTLHLDARRLSERRDEQIPVPQFTTVAGYTTVGLGASWRLPVDSLRLQVRVDNLLDEAYETYIGFPAPGRSVRASLRVTL